MVCTFSNDLIKALNCLLTSGTRRGDTRRQQDSLESIAAVEGEEVKHTAVCSVSEEKIDKCSLYTHREGLS